jgi:uncharacterized protein (DUF1697 family)
VLLRAVNIVGRPLPMGVLREVCEGVGCSDVKTYLQTGNAVVSSSDEGESLVRKLEPALEERAGFAVPVIVRTAAELTQIADTSPFDTTGDPTQLVVSFAQKLPEDPLGKLDPEAFGSERFVLLGRDLYLWLPRGQGQSRLAASVARTPFGKVATARNWRTVTALVELSAFAERNSVESC